MIKYCQIIFLLLFLAEVSSAQKSGPSLNHKSRQILLVLEAQRLRSSHSQTIYGGSAMLGYRVNPTLSAGIGIEVSHTDSLYTHDRYRSVLNFTPIPIYAETRFDLIENSKVTTYLNLAMGMSSIDYERKRFDATGGNMENRHVHQNGFFLKGGFGLVFNINKYISPLVNASCKGFHISSNTREINPHGVTFQVGLLLRSQ
jgi:hypothetical protein